MDNLILILIGILSSWYLYQKLIKPKGKSPCASCNGSCSLDNKKCNVNKGDLKF